MPLKVIFTTLFAKTAISETSILLNYLSEDDKAKYLSIRDPKYRMHFLTGRILALNLFRKLSPDSSSSINLDNNGKPHFAGRPEWGLSITHSNELVACAINTRGVIGLDTEFIRPINLRFFDSHFLRKERDFINQHKTPIKTFFHLWTRKEALSKAHGVGLGLDFRNIDATKDRFLLGRNQMSLTELKLEAGYITSIAHPSLSINCSIYVQKISISNLFHSILKITP